MRLLKIMSATVDYKDSDYDMVYFSGRHTMEREFNRIPVRSGVHAIGSTRGTSSHQQNPFLILCEKSAGEDHGRCYG